MTSRESNDSAGKPGRKAFHKLISCHIVDGDVDVVAVHSENLKVKGEGKCNLVTHPASSNTEG